MNIFKEKIAIVTGAGSGIGRALSVKLSTYGSKVIAVDKDYLKVMETLSLISSKGLEASAYEIDVTDKNDIKKLLNETTKKFGKIDYLFNNAGISISGEVQDISLEQWENLIGVNLFGVIYGTSEAYKLMVEQSHGHIVNISSLAGIAPFPINTPYTASKYAVTGLTSALRYEGGKLGVKISLVCPGIVRTNFYDSIEIMNVKKKDFTDRLPKKIISAPEAAEKILKGVSKNKGIIVFPFHAKLLWFIYRFFPSLFSPVCKKMINDFRSLKAK